MKKVYLMKGMAALAFGLVAASCSKDVFDANAQQQQKEKEFTTNFEKSVMGGRSIDPNQTWATASAMQVSVTPRQGGTLKIYTASPIGNVTAPLYEGTVQAGQKTIFTITKPNDITTLYAAILNDKNMILDFTSFDATEESAEVNMTYEGSVSARAAHRAPSMPDQPTFTSKPDMPTTYKNTLTDAKTAGATDIANGFTTGSVVYLTEKVNKAKGVWGIDIQNTSMTIYFDGNIDFGGNNYQDNDGTTYCVTTGSTLKLQSVRNGLKVYLAPNATLDLTDINWCTFQNSNAAIYMSSGSVIKANTLEMKNYVTCINEGGTIQASKLIVGNNSTLFNYGTISKTADSSTPNTEIILQNTQAELVNNSTITALSLQTSGGGKFYNTLNGSVTLRGATDIYNEADCWMNNGTYTTGTFKCTDTQKVYNNCRLTVTGKFTMAGSASNFILNGDASLICDSFDWESDNYFWLGGASLVRVANTLTANAHDNKNYGFYSTSNQYAVISAKEVAYKTKGYFRVCYHGKIYVDTDKHFDQHWYNQDQAVIYKDDDVIFTTKQGTAPVSWNESTCRPAYNGTGTTTTDSTMYYYYAFEDLGTTDDFDFNDVILRVSTRNTSTGKSSVELVAAGGTMAAQVIYGTTSTVNVGGEVHGEFDVATTTMVNTNASSNGATKAFKPLGTVDVAADADMANLPFGIVVTGNNGQTTKVVRSVANNGHAPLCIVVAGDANGKWFWPKERVNIATAFSQFGAWGASVGTNNDWYKNYAAGTVYTY